MFAKKFEEVIRLYVDPMLYAAEELANAVIIQAATDYRNAMKDLWLCPRNAKAKYMLEECENFFKSRYFNMYTAISGVWLMNKLKEEFETKTRKTNYNKSIGKLKKFRFF